MTRVMNFEASAAQETDPLSELEMRIARRADELAREHRLTTSLNLHCWLVAEAEIIGRNQGPVLKAMLSAERLTPPAEILIARTS